VRETRRLLYDGIRRSWSDHVAENRGALARCFECDDQREGVGAFLERLEADFSGRRRADRRVRGQVASALRR
jgi:enoyl-CoA hydratase/carnithine racemase